MQRGAHVVYYRCMWHFKKGNRPPNLFGGFSIVAFFHHSITSIVSVTLLKAIHTKWRIYANMSLQTTYVQMFQQINYFFLRNSE